jgi:hypothetical protein
MTSARASLPWENEYAQFCHLDDGLKDVSISQIEGFGYDGKGPNKGGDLVKMTDGRTLQNILGGVACGRIAGANHQLPILGSYAGPLSFAPLLPDLSGQIRQMRLVDFQFPVQAL